MFKSILTFFVGASHFEFLDSIFILYVVFNQTNFAKKVKDSENRIHLNTKLYESET